MPITNETQWLLLDLCYPKFSGLRILKNSTSGHKSCKWISGGCIPVSLPIHYLSGCPCYESLNKYIIITCDIIFMCIFYFSVINNLNKPIDCQLCSDFEEETCLFYGLSSLHFQNFNIAQFVGWHQAWLVPFMTRGSRFFTTPKSNISWTVPSPLFTNPDFSPSGTMTGFVRPGDQATEIDGSF